MICSKEKIWNSFLIKIDKEGKAVRLTFGEIERRLNSGLGEDERLEFKPDLFQNKKGINNPILKGIVALANTQGGNLVIGIKQEKEKWIITGTKYDEEYVKNWLSQIVYEYVEPGPDRLLFRVYPIISEEKNKKCIGIEVVKRPQTYFAIRHSGRSSTKPTSYYFPIRIGASTRLLDFQSFVHNIFGDWLRGLSALSKVEIARQYRLQEERKFDLSGLRMRIDEFKSIKEMSESEIEKIIFDEIRNRLPDLPIDEYEPWSDDLKKTIFELTDLLRKEFAMGDEERRKRIVSMLNIIVHRADTETREKIKHDFLEILENLYENPNVKKSSDLIKVLQALHDYESSYIMKMIKDAIESWTKEDFDSRYNDIEIDRYISEDVNRLKELRSYILRSLAYASKAQDTEKVERLKKLYDRIRSR